VGDDSEARLRAEAGLAAAKSEGIAREDIGSDVSRSATALRMSGIRPMGPAADVDGAAMAEPAVDR
jgi:hypothetical protein